ncbi:MAG: anaerobic sulfatase-maturation protein [Planctomycetota bacterium]|nr:MAG: anaerobic sulfatase-maturation protein [Planctomycetota bacterium]
MDTPNIAELGFHVIAKPIGPICNLACAYCFYLEKETHYHKGEQWRMSDETLEQYVRQYIAAQPEAMKEIDFAWQGGEPTLMGIEFFERAIEFQAKYCPDGRTIRNSIQTNGTLLDDDWCKFLRDNDVLVGLSIDGPADLHDKYRYDKQHKPTFDRVIQSMRCMQKHGVDFNALTVVNRHNGDYPRRVYRFLKDAGVEFIQFIAIVERIDMAEDLINVQPPADRDLDKIISERSVRPEQYGRFLIGVFNEWVRNDVGRVFVPLFDQALAAWMGIEPPLCIFQKQCGRALVIEHNGDLYSCDHFVFPSYKLGNIHEKSIAELVNMPRQVQFGRDKESKLPKQCLDCTVRFVCNGGCPKNRILQTPAGEPGLNYLCQGYKMFFNHIAPYMEAMAEELRNQRAAANVMYRINAESKRIQTERAMAGEPIRRNDPCPCGSGKKYKNCCMKKI